MKTGDLVRFRRLGTFPRPDSNEWRIGLLLEYRTWEKVGTVLYAGKIYRVRAENIQKAEERRMQKEKARKKPQIGDVVKKISGMDTNKVGLVIALANDDASSWTSYSRILTVVTEGKTKNWACHLTEVLDEDR